MPPTLVEELGLAYEPSRRSTTEPGSSDSHKPTLRPLAARRIGRVAYLCNILHTHSRVWITLNKLLYAPLRYRLPGPDIHQGERLCARLLPSVLRVSEKNSSRKP